MPSNWGNGPVSNRMIDTRGHGSPQDISVKVQVSSRHMSGADSRKKSLAPNMMPNIFEVYPE